MRQTRENVKLWIDTVNEEGRGLTEWEEDFMDSITEQFETRRSLSERQEEILERIYAEKT
jgi:hypothetical protein